MDIKKKNAILAVGIAATLILLFLVIALSPLGSEINAIADRTMRKFRRESIVQEAETMPAAEEIPETVPTEPEATEPEPTEPGYPTHAQTGEDGSVYNPVPYISQQDYDTPYGTGTVATNGCTLTALSMAATYLTGQEIFPDELAKRYMKADGSLVQRMEAASTVMDLHFHKTTSFQETVEALQAGKVVLALMSQNSIFSDQQHMIVLRGITAEGKILVHDPLKVNYSRSDLTREYESGFPQDIILGGFSGAWIYEFYEPPVIGPTQYPDLQLNREERDLLAKLIWLEARGEPIEGQQAIAEVVFNRMCSDGFPTDTLKGTILAEGQFRSAPFLKDAKADELQYKVIDRALSGPNILPTDVYFFASYRINQNVWGTIGNHIFCGAF